jgi:hypothetical protein
MALFARLPANTADALVECWPEHRWYYRDLEWILKRPINKNIKNITLNEPLLESIKEGGFINPFLFTDKWYPICGSQRLRAAMELTTKQRKNTIVRCCVFKQPVWNPFFHWHDKDEGLKCAQVYFQMAEVAFKSIYCVGKDSKDIDMLVYEEGGNRLHWDVRDGPKKK